MMRKVTSGRGAHSRSDAAADGVDAGVADAGTSAVVAAAGTAAVVDGADAGAAADTNAVADKTDAGTAAGAAEEADAGSAAVADWAASGAATGAVEKVDACAAAGASAVVAAKAGRQPRRVRVRVGRIVPWCVIVVGLAILVWPIANNWLEAWEASENIQQVVSTYDEMSDPEREALRGEARVYNDLLARGGDLSATAPYEEQLSFGGSEMIAYINIPKCSIKLPIFHGTDDRVLAAGVGHLNGTSLPVGGESSHCVLTAHTGLPNRRMFDDIRLLEPGDRFVVWTLGQPLAYRVTDSEVVLPEETSSLAIQDGRDLMTLITCTPYAINSHRLLVHAERCDYIPDEEQIADFAVYVNNRTAPLLVALAAVLVLAIILLARRRKAR